MSHVTIIGAGGEISPNRNLLFSLTGPLKFGNTSGSRLWNTSNFEITNLMSFDQPISILTSVFRTACSESLNISAVHVHWPESAWQSTLTVGMSVCLH
eukprot:TsM_000368300 transcript=TsM_000368300 gene=TsM_000368300